MKKLQAVFLTYTHLALLTRLPYFTESTNKITEVLLSYEKVTQWRYDNFAYRFEEVEKTTV